MDAQNAIRVTVWNEYRHERDNPSVRSIYPHGMHGAIADALRSLGGMDVSTAVLDDTDHGLPEERLAQVDVLLWWGHLAHDDVSDELVERVCRRVWNGMGLVVLHSGHFSKVFKRLMGTSCDLKWRVDPPSRETLWVTSPGHPILKGIEDHFALEAEEMYGEFFDVPAPLETLLISSFTGGEVFRSAMTWQRGAGRIFYFRPGHETYPTYHDANVQRIIANAICWAAPQHTTRPPTFGRRDAGWGRESRSTQ